MIEVLDTEIREIMGDFGLFPHPVASPPTGLRRLSVRESRLLLLRDPAERSPLAQALREFSASEELERRLATARSLASEYARQRCEWVQIDNDTRQGLERVVVDSVLVTVLLRLLEGRGWTRPPLASRLRGVLDAGLLPLAEEGLVLECIPWSDLPGIVVPSDLQIDLVRSRWQEAVASGCVPFGSTGSNVPVAYSSCRRVGSRDGVECLVEGHAWTPLFGHAEELAAHVEVHRMDVSVGLRVRHLRKELLRESRGTFKAMFVRWCDNQGLEDESLTRAVVHLELCAKISLVALIASVTNVALPPTLLGPSSILAHWAVPCRHHADGTWDYFEIDRW